MALFPHFKKGGAQSDATWQLSLCVYVRLYLDVSGGGWGLDHGLPDHGGIKSAERPNCTVSCKCTVVFATGHLVPRKSLGNNKDTRTWARRSPGYQVWRLENVLTGAVAMVSVHFLGDSIQFPRHPVDKETKAVT